jgi:hypothetical protein
MPPLPTNGHHGSRALPALSRLPRDLRASANRRRDVANLAQQIAVSTLAQLLRALMPAIPLILREPVAYLGGRFPSTKLAATHAVIIEWNGRNAGRWGFHCFPGGRLLEAGDCHGGEVLVKLNRRGIFRVSGQ